MADRMTSVRPHGRGIVGGIMEYGRRTRPEMIRAYRQHYQRQLEEAQAALALTDDQLVVETHLGSIVWRNTEEVES